MTGCLIPIMPLLLLLSVTCSRSKDIPDTMVLTHNPLLENTSVEVYKPLEAEMLSEASLASKAIQDLITASTGSLMVTAAPEAMEKMSAMNSVEGSTPSSETASRIITEAPTTGLAPSTALQTPNVSTIVPEIKDKDPKISVIGLDSTKPSTTREETARMATTDSSTTVTGGGNQTQDKPKPTSRTYDHTSQDEEPDIDDKATPKPPALVTQGKQKKSGDEIKLILIIVVIIILVLLLLTIIGLMFRKKRRSGSFRTHSKKSNHDVWAGQVPELGEGKVAQDPTVLENGTGRPKTEVEMTTFICGEKKADSVSETNELAAGDAKANGGDNLVSEVTAQEQAPLLEERSPDSQDPDDKKQEGFLVPPEEQELLGNGVKQ